MRTNWLEPKRGTASITSTKHVMDKILRGFSDAAINQCCAECRLALKNIKEEVKREERRQLEAFRKGNKSRIGKA